MRSFGYREESCRGKAVIAIAMIMFLAFSFLPDQAAARKAAVPAKVKKVKVISTTQTSVTIKWNKTRRAKKYQIWLLKNRKYKKIKTTKARKIKIKGLSAGKVYKLKIRGVNGKRKGKFTLIKIKTKAVVNKPKQKSTNNSAVKNPSQNASAVAQVLNTPAGAMEDINNLDIKDYQTGCRYYPDQNTNWFGFGIYVSDKTKELTFNAVDATPKKVKDFFGKFYKPGAKPVLKVTTKLNGKNGAQSFSVETDPFVSDVYLYATEKSGKIVYGKKLGWNYGKTKHQYAYAMFAWADPENDVFQKMYDDARAKIVAKIKKDGGTYREQFERYGEYTSNFINHGGNASYNITEYGKWVPGYVTYQTGLDMYEDSQYQNWEVHDESSKLYFANSNFKYMLFLGLEQIDCQSAHDLYSEDMMRDIDPNVKLTYNCRPFITPGTGNYNPNHVYLEADWSDNSGISISDDTYSKFEQVEITQNVWDSCLKNNETCRQNFKDLVPNWEEWDIL